ncbi:MAG: DUF2190 family protein [Phycisphaerae bacterium]|jgi:predicted RecA/RadA family phage recombinase
MAQATFVQEGKAIDYTPAADVAAGAVVVQNGLVGFAKTPIAANALGALAVEGVFDVAKANEAVSFGDVVHWDADGDPVGGTTGTGAATKTGGDNALLGRAIKDAVAGDATVRVLVVRDAPGEEEQVTLVAVEDLGAGADISARPVFVSPDAVELVSVGILTQGAPAGVDDANTAVIALKDDAGNVIVSKTYNTANQPPSSDFADLGALDPTHKVLAASEHVTLDVTQGTTANMPAFLLVIKHR